MNINKFFTNNKSLWIPILFVTFYGSGFVGAKFGLPYTGPLTFLSIRFAITVILLLLIVLLFNITWPKPMHELGVLFSK